MFTNATSFLQLISKRNWFRILLVVMLLLTLLKKDFSFRIQLRNKIDTAAPKQEYNREAASQKSVLSDNGKIAASEVFSLNPFGAGNQKTMQDRLWEVDRKKHLAFIKRFKKVAKSEAKKYGIPASIILANGLLLSSAGTDPIAAEGNNYFAIPCTPDWIGKTQEVNGICYRVYDRAWTSFRDHSLYLTTTIGATIDLPDNDDYQAWAKLLENVGFVPDRQFILQAIEEYDLDD